MSPQGRRPHARVHVRRVRAGDWQQLRALRLEALADTPLAFLELYSDAARRDEGSWRRRAEGSAAGEDSAMFIAAEASGEWIGMLGVYRDTPGDAQVVSVYVAPHARGQGVLDELLDQAERWALSVGLHRLRLLVHEDNARALAAYGRLGFTPTGRSFPDPRDKTRRESELTKRLPVKSAEASVEG
jgi:RimJ/RimL family protein N-acetyltransferase